MLQCHSLEGHEEQFVIRLLGSLFLILLWTEGNGCGVRIEEAAVVVILISHYSVEEVNETY